jgi:hypothetical protein
VERNGFLGPIRVSQATVVIGGVIGGLLLLGSSPSVGGVIGAIMTIAISVAVATAQLGSRTAEQWVLVAGEWAARRVLRRNAFRSHAPTTGKLLSAGRNPMSAESDLGVPPGLVGIRIRELPYRGRVIGAVSERRGRLLTAVLACRVVSFSLLDAPTQEQNLAHWGAVLSGCSDTPVRRVQWLERTSPTEGDELARWLHAERSPDIPAHGTALVDSYLELIERSVQISQEHEVLVAVQIDTARVRSRAKDAATATLVEETERVAEGLRRAGAEIRGAMTPRHLARLFRTAFDPYIRLGSLDDQEGLPVNEGLADTVWPIGAIEGWDHYRTDGAVHSTYWIAGWPRVDVGALFLDPLLSQSFAVRTVGVTFEAVGTDRSIRDVEAQVTRAEADQAVRARFGQAETARQQQAYGATRRREAELAAGFSEIRFAGFVTVSAPDVEQLHGARAEVARDASRSHLELRPMYAQQAEAFTFTLPLCRGLR